MTRPQHDGARTAALLARLNRRLLRAYSRHTVAALRARLPLPIALPWLDRLLVSNVEKEVRKDAIIIARAGRAAADSLPPAAAVIEELLGEMARIDREFLAGIGGAPLEVVIRYPAVNAVRRRRIARLLDAGWRICRARAPGMRLREALAGWPQAELEQMVLDLLRLYAEETRVLGEAVRMPALLSPLRRKVLDALQATMERSAVALVQEVCRPRCS